jgi:lipoate-protein ligase A
MQLTTWRLIQSPPAPGAWNMAVDEALLESVTGGKSRPILRLYAWDPPCLSIGYAQSRKDVDQTRLSSHKWDLVRRPTGGRAILHTDELTYAVIGLTDEPRLRGGILESYRRIAQALKKALLILHIDTLADAEPPTSPESNSNGPVCFDVPSKYEITYQGKKLIGSAQSRKLGGVLQHGTLPLHGDLKRITQVLQYPDKAARQAAADQLLARATTIQSILGTKIPWEEVAQAFISAFRTTLALELLPSDLTNEEKGRAANIQSQKYTQNEWTFKK